MTAASGGLVRSDSACTGSGNAGAGKTTGIARSETLAGDLIAAGNETLSDTLRNSTLSSAITDASLTLQDSSDCTVTGDSSVDALTGVLVSGSTVTNFIDRSHAITCESAARKSLDGKTFTLNGGGTLKPA